MLIFPLHLHLNFVYSSFPLSRTIIYPCVQSKRRHWNTFYVFQVRIRILFLMSDLDLGLFFFRTDSDPCALCCNIHFFPLKSFILDRTLLLRWVQVNVGAIYFSDFLLMPIPGLSVTPSAHYEIILEDLRKIVSDTNPWRSLNFVCSKLFKEVFS